VVEARARSTEVFEAGGEVVTKASCDLGKGVGGAWHDEDDVFPASEFDVEDWIPDRIGSRPLAVVRPD